MLFRSPSRRRPDPDLTRQKLWNEAEDQELRQQRPDLAFSSYQQCYRMPLADSSKALALARMARCLQKLNQSKEAQQAYNTLAERYGDLYDAFHRPYGVIAGFELGQSSRKPLVRLRQDLTHGRWELAAEQLDYFLARLQAGGLAQPVETEYVSHFKLARALEQGFRHHGPLRAGESYAFGLAGGDTSYQIYYMLLAAGGGPETLVGLAADLPWVESRLLPQWRSELRIDQAVGARWKAGRWEWFATAGFDESQKEIGRAHV